MLGGAVGRGCWGPGNWGCWASVGWDIGSSKLEMLGDRGLETC